MHTSHNTFSRYDAFVLAVAGVAIVSIFLPQLRAQQADAAMAAPVYLGQTGVEMTTLSIPTAATTTTTATTTLDSPTMMLSEPAVLAEVQSDQNVSKVESDEEAVSVWYKMPARFLGFIPMNMTVRTTVGANGEVQVDRPWYRFLVTGSEAVDDIEPSVQSQVTMIVGDPAAAADSDGEYRLTESTRATLLWTVHGVLSGANMDR